MARRRRWRRSSRRWSTCWCRATSAFPPRLRGRRAGQARRPADPDARRGRGARARSRRWPRAAARSRRLDEDGRTAVLTRIERERPDDFLLIRNIVYLSYYESPAVHEAIRAMGFTYHATPLPDRLRRSAGSTPPPTRRATAAAHFVRTDEVRRVDLSQLDFWEAAMAEPVDVLVIGSGASGALASMVLGQAGLKVVCLEQGGWTAPEDHPHYSADWEWQRQKRWHPNNNIRHGRDDYPVESTTLQHPDVERGRRLDQRLHRALAALSAVRLPQGRRARPRARLADRLRGPRALLRPGRPDRRRERARRQPGDAAA